MKSMKTIFVMIPCMTFFLYSCASPGKSNENKIAIENTASDTIKKTNQTKIPHITGEIATTKGFNRIKTDSTSFAFYLRDLPLKTDNNTVYLFNGLPKGNQNAQYAVIKMDVGNRDLQQCADAVMRLRAEYLYKNKKFEQIHFNFTNGTNACYTKYAAGYRAVVKGSKVNWIKTTKPDTSYKTFRKYLDLVYMYAGTHSLSKELSIVSEIHDIQPGYIFIEGGFPGHAIIVIDVAVNNEGKKLFMLAQSYMPAQEIHVLKNPADAELSPWFEAGKGSQLYTPEWTFEWSSLKKFND